ncbi:MAG: hypothetical protein ABIG63_21315, partial [Chloroflexota bacterium]
PQSPIPTPPMTRITPPRHIVWCTDEIDLNDPFQRKWYMRQVLLRGRAEDLSNLNLDELALWLDEFNLPPELSDLWKGFLEARRHADES